MKKIFLLLLLTVFFSAPAWAGRDADFDRNLGAVDRMGFGKGVLVTNAAPCPGGNYDSATGGCASDVPAASPQDQTNDGGYGYAPDAGGEEHAEQSGGITPEPNDGDPDGNTFEPPPPVDGPGQSDEDHGQAHEDHGQNNEDHGNNDGDHENHSGGSDGSNPGGHGNDNGSGNPGKGKNE